MILESVWGFAPGDIWIVGFDTTPAPDILHWDGATVSAAGPNTLASDVWGDSTDDVWVVGAGVMHWDGTAWTDVPSPSTLQLESVWGTATADVWAVGQQGTTAHWDGAAWSPVEAPPEPLNGVGLRPPTTCGRWAGMGLFCTAVPTSRRPIPTMAGASSASRRRTPRTS